MLTIRREPDKLIENRNACTQLYSFSKHAHRNTESYTVVLILIMRVMRSKNARHKQKKMQPKAGDKSMDHHKAPSPLDWKEW